MKSALLIFAKYPVRGKVKTRIALEFGDDFAFELSNFCIRDLVEKAKNLDQDVYFVVDSQKEADLFKYEFGIESIVSEGDNLSDKFDFAFRKAFSKNYDKVILVPTDIPFISTRDIENAFEELDSNNYVFGPENNGGIYLMGMKSPYKNIFEGVRWSTEHSFRDLLRNVEGEVAVLELMDDLNTGSDIVRHSEALLSKCPEISRFLRKLEIKNESS